MDVLPEEYCSYENSFYSTFGEMDVKEAEKQFWFNLAKYVLADADFASVYVQYTKALPNLLRLIILFRESNEYPDLTESTNGVRDKWSRAFKTELMNWKLEYKE